MTSKQRAEATGKPAAKGNDLAVMWRNKRFVLPRAEDFPLEALEAEEDGKHLLALKVILGPEQYTTWRSLASTAADAEDFSTKVMRELGRGNP